MIRLPCCFRIQRTFMPTGKVVMKPRTQACAAPLKLTLTMSGSAVSRFLPKHWKSRFRVVTDLFTAAVSAVVAWSAFRLMMGDREAGGMTIAFVPVWICEAILPVAFAVIALRYLLFAVEHFRHSRAPEELS